MIAEPVHRAPLDVASISTLIPLALLDSAPDQPREELPDIEALARNISDVGLLQPICARRDGSRYTILSGHRRAAAYRWLQEHDPQPEWASIPAVVLRVNDELARLVQISAQVHAEAWTMLEEAQVLEHLYQAGLAQADIAQLLNKTPSWVSKRLSVLRDPALATFVLAGDLSAGVAAELISVRAVPVRREMAKRAVAEVWTQAQARQHVRHAAVHPLVRDVGRRARSLSKDLRGIDPLVVTGDVLADLERLALVIDQRFPRRSEKSAA